MYEVKFCPLTQLRNQGGEIVNTRLKWKYLQKIGTLRLRSCGFLRKCDYFEGKMCDSDSMGVDMWLSAGPWDN